VIFKRLAFFLCRFELAAGWLVHDAELLFYLVSELIHLHHVRILVEDELVQMEISRRVFCVCTITMNQSLNRVQDSTRIFSFLYLHYPCRSLYAAGIVRLL
jgi:hypothetical protein